jgi:dUTP pyrophosphatase
MKSPFKELNSMSKHNGPNYFNDSSRADEGSALDIIDFIDNKQSTSENETPLSSKADKEIPLPKQEVPLTKSTVEENLGKKLTTEKLSMQEEIIVISVKKRLSSEVPIPTKPSANVSCYDLYADLTGTSYGNSLHIPVGQSRLVPTNLIFNIPQGYELQVRPKTGYVDDGVVIQYTPYTIDTEEELKIFITNTSRNEVKISHGQKIAQIAIAPILKSSIVERK